MVTLGRRTVVMVVGLVVMMGAAAAQSFDEAADIVVKRLDKRASNPNNCKSFNLSREVHLAYVRTGVNVVVGDVPSIFDAKTNTTTAVPGTAKENMMLSVDDDGDDIMLTVINADKSQCKYDVEIEEGTVMGVKGDDDDDDDDDDEDGKKKGKKEKKVLYEAGVLKVGAFESARSKAGVTCTAAPGGDEMAFWEGQVVAFVRFGRPSSNRTDVVFGKSEGYVKKGDTFGSVPEPSSSIFREGAAGTTPTITVSTKAEGGAPSECVFTATVVNGTVFGVNATAATTTTASKQAAHNNLRA